VEDPGWHPARLSIEQAGLDIVPIPVDADGLRVDALHDVRAVLVTPAHQFPTGVTLSRERRAALVEWASDHDALIIEDDYDSELSEQRPGAVQGLAPERVVLLGSASKRLAPGLRLGWMLTPSWLTWPLTTTRAALLSALARRLPQLTVREAPPAGVFVLAEGEIDEHATVEYAARHGVGVEPLGLHRFEPDGTTGLVLGYGALAAPALERAIDLLSNMLPKAPDQV